MEAYNYLSFENKIKNQETDKSKLEKIIENKKSLFLLSKDDKIKSFGEKNNLKIFEDLVKLNDDSTIFITNDYSPLFSVEPQKNPLWNIIL